MNFTELWTMPHEAIHQFPYGSEEGKFPIVFPNGKDRNGIRDHYLTLWRHDGVASLFRRGPRDLLVLPLPLGRRRRRPLLGRRRSVVPVARLRLRPAVAHRRFRLLPPRRAESLKLKATNKATEQDGNVAARYVEELRRSIYVTRTKSTVYNKQLCRSISLDGLSVQLAKALVSATVSWSYVWATYGCD